MLDKPPEDCIHEDEDQFRQKNEKPRNPNENLYPNCDTTIWLRSCEKEVLDPIGGVTTGEVPSWLQGNLLRNGPGSLKVGDQEFEHLFDSSALLHKFCIKDGKVTYQNRFLQSETYKKNQAAQRIVVTEFGTSAVPDPCHTIFQRVSAVFHPWDTLSDNAMISIYPFGDELFAMTETPIIYPVESKTLTTGSRVNLGTKLGIMNHTSHPHVMPDGTVYNLGMAVYSTGPRYCIIKFPPKYGDGQSVFDQASIVASLPSRWRFHPSYMHTFGITENYFVIVEQPLSVSTAAVLKNILLNKPMISAMRWYQEAGTKIYLISRKTGKLEANFNADTFFYMHIINQYEEDGHMVLDICCYKDAAMLDGLYVSAMKEAQHNSNYAAMFHGRPLRFVLPLKEKSTLLTEEGSNLTNLVGSQSESTILSNGDIFVKPELLSNLGCETPRINYESFCGKKYQYFYGISSDVDSPNPGMLIKVDVQNKTNKTWGEENLYPCEPIFVGRPGGTAEDDGVILSAVVWGGEKTNQVGLVILDAKSLEEISRTIFEVNGPVPKCLHGWHEESYEDCIEPEDEKFSQKSGEAECNENLYPNCDTSIWLRSCEKEVLDPIGGVTTGEVPSWLQGNLLRNGPGSLKVGDQEFEHLFDSSALLHKFCIKDGKVTYQNRFLQSETYKKNQAAQRIVVTEFGTSAVPDPCHTIFKRVSAVFHPWDTFSDNAMISIYPFGDELFAMTETPIIYPVKPQDLTTGTRVNLGSKLGIINHTSHPHVMPDGTVYNLGMAVYSTGPRYCIIEFPPKCGDGQSVFDQASIVASLPSRWRFHPSYMHTFGITEKYFVIVEQPLSVSTAAVLKNTILNKPIASALRWYQKAETKIYLISRKSGKLEASFSTDSFFYLHIINQYEEDGHVVLDICCYKDPAMLDCMYISALKEAQHNPNYAAMFRGRPLRFVLPLKEKSTLTELLAEGGSGGNLNNLEGSLSEATLLSNGVIFVKPELLCTLGCETPRINYELFCGKKYQYFYGISSDVDSPNPGMLIKVDVMNKTKKTWGEKNVYPSEPIFVARPGGTAEDDGVILSSVVWGAEKTNQVGLVILDAKSWKEISRTTFVIDGPVPKCLHGWFVNS